MAGLLVLGLTSLSLWSCGDETAPQGATIVAPADETIEYAQPPFDFAGQTSGPLQFQVIDENGNPLPGVKIRFFGGSQTLALTERGVDSLNFIFTPLDSSDATFFETTTDERGLSPVDIYATYFVSGCVAAEDITGNATVTASVGSASAVWTIGITSTCS
jgi:hypothetical protein